MSRSSATFRFYASLTDFLPLQQRGQTFTHSLKENPSIKDTIEALGVPHPEVELILRNGEAVDFSYQVQDGDRLSIYPHFSTLEISDKRLRPSLEVNRFVLDVHLGKLATQMRLLGFDTLYENDYCDPELADISHQQQRILLTRDIGLLKRSIVQYGYWIRGKNTESQLAEVLHRFSLFPSIEPFKRCLRCNGLITSVKKEAIREQLEPLTQKHYHEFYQCTNCHQIYWKGSHYAKLQKFIQKFSETSPRS